MTTHFSIALLLFTILTFLNCSGLPKSSFANVSSVSEVSSVGKIIPVGNLSEKRAGHSATLLANGKVVVIGGMERNGIFFDSAEIFDAETNKFTVSKSRMSRARTGHTATLLPDGKVLIVGGYGNGTREMNPISTNQAWVFNYN